MSTSCGDVAILVRGPVAMELLLVSALALLVPLLSWLRGAGARDGGASV